MGKVLSPAWQGAGPAGIAGRRSPDARARAVRGLRPSGSGTGPFPRVSAPSVVADWPSAALGTVGAIRRRSPDVSAVSRRGIVGRGREHAIPHQTFRPGVCGELTDVQGMR